MLKANKAAYVPAQREDHHATRTGEDRMEMIRAWQQLSLRGVSGFRGSWLRVPVCIPPSRKVWQKTEKTPEQGRQFAARRASTGRGKGEVKEMNRLQ